MSFVIPRLDQWPIIIPAASADGFGVMSPADKSAIDDIVAMLQVIDEFDLSSSQNIFHTSKTPLTPILLFVVNGQLQRLNLDFSVSGSTVQWVSADFPLAAGDTVQIIYEGV